MHFLAVRRIVRDIKKIFIANNHIITILSKTQGKQEHSINKRNQDK